MENDERLGASFSIDVTDLKTGLSQANRMIRESESEFKAAAAGMDDWRKSEEGLTAKIKSLNDVTEIQQKKVDALQEEYDKLIENGLDPASKEAVELRTKINNETAALNKNKAEAKKLEKALEDLSDAEEEAGDEAKEAGDGFTVMAGAAADLVAEGITRVVDWSKQAITTFLGLSESTLELRENLTKLKTSFQTAELSAEDAEKTFDELYSIMGDEGGASEAAQQLAKISKSTEGLEANTRILTGVMAEYGESIPLTGLAEGIAASSAMSSVQGVLADALEWQGINLDDFNAKLEKLSTEEERSAYIQKTLTDLYGASADLYKENNASVITARKETLKYNKVMAELGEELEPVNNEITAFKTELAKELSPVLKKQVTPAIKEFVKRLKDNKTAEKFGKAVGWVAENFETLTTVTLTAVAAFTIFNTTMKVAGAITAAKTAVEGLAASVSFATKMQTGWNAAMASNPIGAVITAVALLTTAIVLLAQNTSDASKKTDALTESQRETVTAAQEAAEAYRENRAAADEMAAGEIANIDYANKLWKELQKLADENGKVKEGYESRAQFILNELNAALDTEYTMTDGIINKYKDIKTAIENVIQTKKAQILLEAYEDSYREAIEKVAEAEKARAIQAQELLSYEEKVATAKRAAQDAQAKYETALAEGVTGRRLELLKAEAAGYDGALEIEKNRLAEKQEEYNKSEAALLEYYEDINSYEQASTLILEGETTKAIGYLNNLGSGFQTAASTAQLSAKEQKKTLEQQVIDTEVNARLLKDAYNRGTEGVTEEMVELAEEQAKKAKEEFFAVGGDITKGISEGAEEETWTLTGTMSNLISRAVNAAKKAAGIQSPARAFKKPVGGMIGLGVAEGINDSTTAVVKSVKNQVGAIRDAYDLSDISSAVNTGAGISRNKTAGADNASNSGGVTVYQTNNYKQAYESPIEKYKSKQQLYAAARLIKAGAY